MNKDDREVCEWTYNYKSMLGYANCFEKVVPIVYVRDFKYCPYCGKPIKIKGDK